MGRCTSPNRTLMCTVNEITTHMVQITALSDHPSQQYGTSRIKRLQRTVYEKFALGETFDAVFNRHNLKNHLVQSVYCLLCLEK